MSRGFNLFGMPFEHAFPIPPTVPDFPADFDWQVWSKDAIFFPLKQNRTLQIYAVNPNDCSCYSLANFARCDAKHCGTRHCNFVSDCTVIDSKIYLLGRNDPNDYFLTDLWIWDILEAQKMKNAGEPYDWKLGPRPNSPKGKVLVFSLCGDLYALDICRSFYSPAHSIEEMKAASEARKKYPNDFERLPVSSSSKSSLSWVNLFGLHVDSFSFMEVKGYCCLHDRFVLHMFNSEDFSSSLFCFDVTTGNWTHRRFTDLPLARNVHIEDLPALRFFCVHYSGQVQNHALFFSTYTGELSVFDFDAVNELIEKGSVSGSDLKYPCFSVEMTPTMKKGLESVPHGSFRKCETFYLGGKKNCWIGFFRGDDFVLYVWICTFDLEKKTCMETHAKISETGSGSTNKRGMREKTTFLVANDIAKLWTLGHNSRVLPNL